VQDYSLIIALEEFMKGLPEGKVSVSAVW